jgi:hypothetical protein
LISEITLVLAVPDESEENNKYLVKNTKSSDDELIEA